MLHRYRYRHRYRHRHRHSTVAMNVKPETVVTLPVEFPTTTPVVKYHSERWADTFMYQLDRTPT